MLTVYWANLSSKELQQRTNLLMPQPKMLISELFKNRYDNDKTYNRCPANKMTLRNTYYTEFPFDIDVQFDENDIPHGVREDWFIPRQRHFVDRVTAELDIGWFFFCESPLVIEMTPPYAHKTTAQKYANMTTGSFDISTWFRPLMSTHLLWSDETRFVATEKDPMIYIRFMTDQKIRLVQFELTQKLIDISIACASHPNTYRPHLPLADRYEKFQKAKMHKTVLREIQQNLML